MAQETYISPVITTSGAAFADLKAGGLAHLLSLLVTANPAVENPASQSTVDPTGGGATGGLLPAGDYFVSYTYGDGAGETTIGDSQSAVFTVGAANKPRVTFNDTPPAGAVFRNVYLTAADGAAGTETLYITGVAVATGTVDLLFAAPTQGSTPLPAVNSTGAAAIAPMLNVWKAGNLDMLWRQLSEHVSQYLHGVPLDYHTTLALIHHVDYVWAAYKQATKEIFTLIAANPGTLTHTATDTQDKYYRSFS